MKLNYKRTFLVGLAFFSICAFWQMYDGIIPLILRDTYQLDNAKRGIVMGIDNMLALFLLPLFVSVVHYCFAFPIICKLLTLFNMYNTSLFIIFQYHHKALKK